MPFNTHWIINRRVIADRIDQNLTLELQQAHDDLIQGLLEQSERQTSHVILDCSDVSFPTFRKRDWIKNPHLGWLVLHGVKNPLYKLSVAVVLQILGIRYHFADNEDDALQFLQDVDISLPKLEAV